MYRLHPSWIGRARAGRARPHRPARAVQSWFSFYNDDPTNIRNIRDGRRRAVGHRLLPRQPLAHAARRRARRRRRPSIVRDPVGGVDSLTQRASSLPRRRRPRSRARPRRDRPAGRHRRQRRAGSRSRSRSTSRPTARPQVFVTPGGDPPVAPAHRAATFARPTSTRWRPSASRPRSSTAPVPSRPADAVANLRVIERIFARRRAGSRPATLAIAPRAPGRSRAGVRSDSRRRARLARVGARRRRSPSDVARRLARRRRLVFVNGGRRRPIPRFVDETAASGLAHTLRRRRRTTSAAASRCSTATTTGARTSTSPAARARPRCSATTAPPAAPSASSRLADPVTDLDAVTGAYPLDVDGDGVTDLAVLRLGESVLLRGPGRLPVRARERAVRASTAGRLTRGIQRHLGARRSAADARRSATTSSSTRPATPTRLQRQRARAARTPTADATRAPIAAFARLLRAVDAVQRLGPLRTPRPAHQQRPPLLRHDGEEQLWRIEPGEPPRRYTARDGWVPLQV